MEERIVEQLSYGASMTQRRGMYLSGDDFDALHLMLREIYVNSLDALMESGTKNAIVDIAVDSKTNTAVVKDNGPGIPNKYLKDKDNTPSVVAAYLLPHTGSHFSRETNAIGLNGVGASTAGHLSSSCKIENDDGKMLTITTIKGSNKDGGTLEKYVEKKTTGRTGVTTTFVANKAVFGDVYYDKTAILKELDTMMKFYPKVVVNFTFNGQVQKIYYPSGLKENNTIMYYESENLILNLRLRKQTELGVKTFGNRLFLPEGGSPLSHFKTQLTRTINGLSDYKLDGSQIFNLFAGELCVFVTNPQYSNQSKTKLANKEVNNEITLALKQVFDEFTKSGEWEKLLKTLEAEAKAEAAAERARQKVKNAMENIKKGGSRKKISEKLKDCEVDKGGNLFICEGDSAANSLIRGRDAKTCALFPIRGKIINCLSNPRDKFLANEEVQQIAQILGGGILENFTLNKVKYGKVIIASDQDQDGFHIRILLLTFFYVCMPELLKQGRVYIAEGPLYFDSNTSRYISTETEWNKVKDKKNFTRAKGLGELDIDAVTQAYFGKHKRWNKVVIKNWQQFGKQLEMLMGDEPKDRQDFLFDRVDFEKIKFL